MDEMNILEDLENVVMKKVYYKEGIPEEIIGIIKKTFEECLNCYKQLHCDVYAIAEYIDGNVREVENYVTKNIGENRKDKQMNELQIIFRKMEMELQNSEREFDEKREEKQKDEILGIEWGDEEKKNSIVEKLQDSLKDVRNTQKRILDSNGYSMDRIDTIDEKVQVHMDNFIKQNQNGILQLLQRDSSFLKERILSEYSEYLLEISSKKNAFKERLNANISQMVQNQFSKQSVANSNEERKQRQEQKGEILPDDAII